MAADPTTMTDVKDVRTLMLNAERLGACLQCPEHVLMAAVTAVEIADRDHGTLQ